MDYIISIIVPIVSVVVAILSASLTYYFSQKAKATMDERKLKESYYQEYMRAVGKLALDVSDVNALSDYALAHNTLPLIATSNIMKLVNEFQEIVIGKGDIAVEYQNEVLTKIVLEMRKDLYPKRKSKQLNTSFPTINLTAVGKRGKYR